ncbi:LysR family transcriptional regulator [Roseobacter sp. HKCCD9010]|uniref:LysR family transcriptional regulator n=1 Tax=unclassified Roseobacter TaxID=196798 RepID=UPI001492C43B|nr:MULTISPECIES: LysR family transcriptional regulator [unclassified Roseobacter]MBF9051207.1 LysR family transcriptional regulator [Rhodobacterales bacterium HKCCD4356]NNV13254.1 LysR family transcriptional regulator [Roseobacter sp. HKCCD7357]NNV17505.1 LysR family transcriptional regulator [Roseobacter sp. HKCCD8768]NNV27111.1 LysR family transcriptional regulator [Roseobacter sp. HKCCD8192]NNV31231.1 LysR family transcriptional regulator [Roseobacter sp. HKCCD9061]
MSDHIPLRLLQVFETVIRSGGFRPASRMLNVSQAAVSQSIRQLEDHLGIRLLDRSTRPATLTRAGQILHGATSEGLARIDAALEEVRALQQEEDPDTITLACSVGVATYWLMPRLALVTAEMPEIAVNVLTTHHGAPELAPGVDLAIRFGDGAWQDGAVSLLFEECIRPVCHPNLAGVKWQQSPALHVTTDDPRWVSWAEYRRRAGLSPSQGRAVQFTNYVQATQAALNGQGVMLGWRSITGDLEATGQLVPVGPAVAPADDFYLVAARGPAKAETRATVAQALQRAVGVVAKG